MGWQVIKQPDGKLAVYSSVVDDLIAQDMSAEECADLFAEEHGREFAQAMRKVETIIGHVLAGEPEKAYHQFAMTWEDLMQAKAEYEALLAEDNAASPS